MKEYAEKSGDIALEIFDDGMSYLKIDKTLQVLTQRDVQDLISVMKDLIEFQECPAGVSYLKPV